MELPKKERLKEWKALRDWAYEQIGDSVDGLGGLLSTPEKVRAITWTMQNHWQEALEAIPPEIAQICFGCPHFNWLMPKKCQHYWVLDEQNVGTCKKCGAQRHFPAAGEEADLLKEKRSMGGKRLYRRGSK